MTLPELRACLDRLGVRLSVRLVVDAPVGVLTPEVKAALADHKPALLALLVGVESSIVPTPQPALSPPTSAPPSNMDLILNRIAGRQGGRVVELDGGGMIAPGPAAPNPSEGTEAPAPSPWPPRPAELADWPVEWRERWGRLANRLDDEGIPWPDHERIALDQISAERAAGLIP